MINFKLCAGRIGVAARLWSRMYFRQLAPDLRDAFLTHHTSRTIPQLIPTNSFSYIRIWRYVDGGTAQAIP